MAATTHTVVYGDTLSEIAAKYKSDYGYSNTYTYMNYLVDINEISNPNIIAVGQVIALTESSKSSSTSVTKKKTTTSQVTIKVFGLQSNTDRTVYVTWAWTKSNTDKYRVIWYYATGDGVWFVGSDSITTDKQSVYNAPSNATKVKVKVKPISKTKTVNNKETSYWTGSWCTAKTYNFSDNPPSQPSAPEVKIENLKLTASLSNLDINATQVQFQIVKNDKTVFNTGTATIKTTAASYSCTVSAGSEYKVRCRGVRGKVYGEWSEYSSNVGTQPAATKGWVSVKALSETEVQLDWYKVSNATGYEVQYTTKKRYFDSSSEVKSHTVDGTAVDHAEITGLETGQEWFFRVRATNDNGESAWSEITSIKLGEAPSAPTTWSSTTTATTGKEVTLYWVHNSVDGSSQTYAKLELTIDGTTTTQTIKNSTDEDEKDLTSSYVIDTSSYTEGTTIKWRVKTRGIITTYSDWSVQRTIDVYAPPTLELNVTDTDGNALETVESFPFYISGIAGPNTQTPIGYYVTITADETYETVNNIGNTQIVNAGESVYSKYYDMDDALLLQMSAGSINLENNISYTVTCTVSMDSGLTAEASVPINVSWTELDFEPNAEISIDEETLTASIRPFCVDEDENLIEGITLSVYRREFDGTFTELATGLVNTDNTYITDPHPALDYARYRIVSITDDTGTVGYYDVPGQPVGETAIVIQWDEKWSSFNTTEEEALEQPSWAGSMLKLPYNIDVSDNYNKDVEHIEYIGRQNPVSYYGTHVGQTPTWNVEIEKDDVETLYALRRLAIYMGDVYVREPSGSGYWASISVTFSQKHRELTIPVTLSITRVAGGV